MEVRDKQLKHVTPHEGFLFFAGYESPHSHPAIYVAGHAWPEWGFTWKVATPSGTVLEFRPPDGKAAFEAFENLLRSDSFYGCYLPPPPVPVKDKRTLAQLAKEALDVQDACNLSGVLFSWKESITRLRELLSPIGTNELNHHPINQMWAYKVYEMTGCAGTSCEEFSRIYAGVRHLAAQQQPMVRPVEGDL